MNKYNLSKCIFLLIAMSINVAIGDEETQPVPQKPLPTRVELDKNLFLLDGVKPDEITKAEERYNDSIGFFENDPIGLQISEVLRDQRMLGGMKALLCRRISRIDPKALWLFLGEAKENSAEKGSALEREILHLEKVEAALTEAHVRSDGLSLQRWGKIPDQFRVPDRLRPRL